MYELLGICVMLAALARSEEHTSELQSQSNLVCRLLLEKKKDVPSPKRAEPGPPPRGHPTPTGCSQPLPLPLRAPSRRTPTHTPRSLGAHPHPSRRLSQRSDYMQCGMYA